MTRFNQASSGIRLSFIPGQRIQSMVAMMLIAVETASANKTEIQKKSAESRKPETKGIEPWKRHVSGANHQRDQVIGKPEQDGHGYEENHGRTMHGEHAIEHLWRDKIVVRVHQLDADNGCFNTADDEKNQGVKDVQNTQALVIDRGHPLMQRFNPWSTCRFSVLNS